MQSEFEITYYEDLTLPVTKNIVIELIETPDYDYVPFGESMIKNNYVEIEVYIYGDIPEEIKEDIRKRFPKKQYDSSTSNFYWELK